METVSNFSLIKEKIIKTDQVLQMYLDKSNELKKIQPLYLELKSKLIKTQNEMKRLKLDNERLSDNVENINGKYKPLEKELNELKIEHSQLLNKYQSTMNEHQLKYHLICEEFEENKTLLNNQKKSPTKKGCSCAKAEENKKLKNELSEKNKKLMKVIQENENLSSKVEIMKNCSKCPELISINLNLTKELEEYQTKIGDTLRLKNLENELSLKSREINDLKKNLETKNKNLHDLMRKIKCLEIDKSRLMEENMSRANKQLEINLLNDRGKMISIQTQTDVIIESISSIRGLEIAEKSEEIFEESDEYVKAIIKSMIIPNLLAPLADNDNKNDKSTNILKNRKNKKIKSSSGNFKITNFDEIKNKLKYKSNRKMNIKRKKKRKKDLLSTLIALKKSNINFTISSENLNTCSCSCPKLPKCKAPQFPIVKPKQKIKTYVKSLNCNAAMCHESNTHMLLKGKGKNEELLGFYDIKTENSEQSNVTKLAVCKENEIIGENKRMCEVMDDSTQSGNKRICEFNYESSESEVIESKTNEVEVIIDQTKNNIIIELTEDDIIEKTKENAILNETNYNINNENEIANEYLNEIECQVGTDKTIENCVVIEKINEISDYSVTTNNTLKEYKTKEKITKSVVMCESAKKSKVINENIDKSPRSNILIDYDSKFNNENEIVNEHLNECKVDTGETIENRVANEKINESAGYFVTTKENKTKENLTKSVVLCESTKISEVINENIDSSPRSNLFDYISKLENINNSNDEENCDILEFQPKKIKLASPNSIRKVKNGGRESSYDQRVSATENNKMTNENQQFENIEVFESNCDFSKPTSNDNLNTEIYSRPLKRKISHLKKVKITNKALKEKDMVSAENIFSDLFELQVDKNKVSVIENNKINENQQLENGETFESNCDFSKPTLSDNLNSEIYSRPIKRRIAHFKNSANNALVSTDSDLFDLQVDKKNKNKQVVFDEANKTPQTEIINNNNDNLINVNVISKHTEAINKLFEPISDLSFFEEEKATFRVNNEPKRKSPNKKKVVCDNKDVSFSIKTRSATTKKKIENVESSSDNKQMKKMPPSKAKMLFEQLINYSNEEKALNEVVQHFMNEETDHIAELILNQISIDFDTPDNKYNPAPIMTETQRSLLGFMSKLEQANLENIYDKYLDLSEQKLLTCDNFKIMDPVVRFYLAICKLKGKLIRMRRFVCDIFYFLKDHAVPIFFIVLTSWSEILPLEVESSEFPLARVLIQIVRLKSCNQPGFNLLPLNDLLVKYYGYSWDKWDSNKLFDELYQEFLRNPVRSSDFAILVFCKNHPDAWVYKKIEECFIPLIKKLTSDNFKATVIILIGNLTSQLDKKYVILIKEWLLNLSKAYSEGDIITKSIDLCIKRLDNK